MSAAPDRRAGALAVLGAFYMRQGHPERAAPLLRAARRLLGPAPTDAPTDKWDAAAESVARHLAYAQLLSGETEQIREALQTFELRAVSAGSARQRAAARHLAERARQALSRSGA